MLDLRILADVCICLRLAEARIKIDWMLLLQRARPKREGMPAAQPTLHTFFARFRHDSIILITPSKHNDRLIIPPLRKHRSSPLDTLLTNHSKSRGWKLSCVNEIIMGIVYRLCSGITDGESWMRGGSGRKRGIIAPHPPSHFYSVYYDKKDYPSFLNFQPQKPTMTRPLIPPRSGVCGYREVCYNEHCCGLIIYSYTFTEMQKEGEKAHERHPTSKEKLDGLRYCRTIKQFLEGYKTTECTLNQQHNQELCHHFHSYQDRRRNPYLNHTFLYLPHIHCWCDRDPDSRSSLQCPNFHNLYEQNFHPLVYKTQKCPNYYDCHYHFQCYGLHHQDELHFSLGDYFRFDINTFKTKPCPRKDAHERKVCLYYHNDKDRRRANFQHYNHIPCTRINCNCNKSHNKIEQLYHPSRYKSKFCQTFGKDPNTCEYRDFCSFAHTKSEIIIELYDEDNKDQNYITSYYKTIWCPYTLDHDRGRCSYAHNFQDYRRNPKEYKYIAENCENWNFKGKIESIEDGGCEAGLNCMKCHGWMQEKFHPQYKPQPVKKGKSYINKDDMIEKKLINARNSTKKEEKNIEAIAYKEIQASKPSKFTVGAPFFKSDRQTSQASKKTKAKTGNFCSDKSNNEDQPRKNIVGMGFQKKRISSVYFQDEMWHFDEPEQEVVECRSRSHDNSSEFAPSYSSHTIKDVFRNQNQLMDKLMRWRVNEISLVHADQKKISNMSFLNSHQKQKLVNKLKEYSLKKEIGFVEYSQGLTLFFVKNGADGILQKLRSKRVNEHKIRKFQSKHSTKDFTFLTEEEKEVLPRLVKRYNAEAEFGSIKTSIQQFIEKKADPNRDFNNDN